MQLQESVARRRWSATAGSGPPISPTAPAGSLWRAPHQSETIADFMKFFRRPLITLGLAAMLPTVVFAAVSVFYLLRAERERVTNATVEQSRIVMTLVDTQLQRHLAAL